MMHFYIIKYLKLGLGSCTCLTGNLFFHNFTFSFSKGLAFLALIWYRTAFTSVARLFNMELWRNQPSGLASATGSSVADYNAKKTKYIF